MSNEAPDHEDVALLDSTTAVAVTQGEGDETNDHLSQETFGENLPEDEVRKIDPHMTRPLESEDLKPSPDDASRLADQIAAALRSRKFSPTSETPLLNQLTLNLVPSAQIRLRPGTTRKKIAGAGVTSEPLVFQSEASEALLEKWTDRTLGTNIQTNDGSRPVSPHPVEPVAAAPIKPRLSRSGPLVVGIAIIAALAVAAVVSVFLYQHFVPGSAIKLPW